MKVIDISQESVRNSLQGLTIKEENFAKQNKFMDTIFTKLFVIFPAWEVNIKSSKQLAEIKDQWIKSFIENKINSQELIERGFKGARASVVPYFPTCGQFVQWCAPESDTEKAYGGAHNPMLRALPLSKEYVSKRKLKGQKRMKDLLSIAGSSKYKGDL
jgi:hypothetical protein